MKEKIDNGSLVPGEAKKLLQEFIDAGKFPKTLGIRMWLREHGIPVALQKEKNRRRAFEASVKLKKMGYMVWIVDGGYGLVPLDNLNDVI